MSPEEAEDPSNRFKIRETLRDYYEKVKSKTPRFKIGDKVRVQKQQGSFGRGYDMIFTNEIYNISEINETLPVPMYTLTSFDEEDTLMARFYGNELQKISGDPFEMVDIYKKEKALDGTIRYLAKLKVNGELLRAWIKQRDINKYQQNGNL